MSPVLFHISRFTKKLRTAAVIHPNYKMSHIEKHWERQWHDEAIAKVKDKVSMAVTLLSNQANDFTSR